MNHNQQRAEMLSRGSSATREGEEQRTQQSNVIDYRIARRLYGFPNTLLARSAGHLGCGRTSFGRLRVSIRFGVASGTYIPWGGTLYKRQRTPQRPQRRGIDASRLKIMGHVSMLGVPSTNRPRNLRLSVPKRTFQGCLECTRAPRVGRPLGQVLDPTISPAPGSVNLQQIWSTPYLYTTLVQHCMLEFSVHTYVVQYASVVHCTALALEGPALRQDSWKCRHWLLRFGVLQLGGS